MQKKILYVLAAILIPLLSFPINLFAVGSSGLENASFSAKSMALADAVAAQADEPAAISYNPAGISYLPGFQVQPNIAFISTFTYRESSVQSNDRSSGTLVPIPTGYITANPGNLLWNRFAFGVGSDSPFGLSNKYNTADRAVQYTGYVNYLKMYTIKPVVSFKLFDWLSIGGGPIWYRVFDYGGVEAYPNKLIAGGLADGQVRVNTSGNGWGWHFGVLAKPHKMHQFGFYFRSPVVINTRGLGKVENSSFAPGGNFEAGVNSDLPLPLNIEFAYAFKPTDRLTTELDLGYTRWSIFERANIDHNSTNLSVADNAILNALGIADRDWSDGYSINWSGSYKATKVLTLLLGSWYYWKVVPHDHWTPAIPDANHLGFSFGTSYAVYKHFTVDLAYLIVLGLPRRIDNNITEAIGGKVDGKYHSFSQEFAVTATYHWDDLFTKLSKKGKPAQIENPNVQTIT